MAGNELEVCRFLLSGLNILELQHVGVVEEVASPTRRGLKPIRTPDEISKVSTSDSKKKADIYVNGRGVSIKQKGSSVLYNRIQRKNLESLYQQLNFVDIADKLQQIDTEVARFHRGEIKRDREWSNFFSALEFKQLLSYLMLRGSPNHGDSKYPAEFILEAPTLLLSATDVKLYSFDGYFDRYYQNFYLSIRRSWIGQLSRSEHGRALSISKKPENAPWVFHDIISSPPTGWREEFPANQRKTVYYLMITKVGN